jgi:hypothetical protein
LIFKMFFIMYTLHFLFYHPHIQIKLFIFHLSTLLYFTQFPYICQHFFIYTLPNKYILNFKTIHISIFINIIFIKHYIIFFFIFIIYYPFIYFYLINFFLLSINPHYNIFHYINFPF